MLTSAVQVVFRVDSSLEMGAGHVMRCLALADALSVTGVSCRFITRAHLGNITALVAKRGYEVSLLPVGILQDHSETQPNPYARWLGVHCLLDAEQTIAALANRPKPKWLVVDHYALDHQWERMVRHSCEHLLVLDDLANRNHDADMLIDQTLGRLESDYLNLVNLTCQVRCGVQHVLLRSEFNEWRKISLERRVDPILRRILISLGGVDQYNISSQILRILGKCGLPADIEICIILGESSPWIADLRQLVRECSTKVQLIVAAENMAELLAGCDLAIGAAGTSCWERCYLGVPTLMLVLAENQREIAARVAEKGAVKLLATGVDYALDLEMAVLRLLANPAELKIMSKNASELVVRSGAGSLAQDMLSAMK